jgi:DNA-binding CsgD family transcriptional regulator
VSRGSRGEISEREAEVLAAISEHQTNAQIARSLHISVRTVETHVSSLLRKFGVSDRRALAASANHTQARVSARPGRFVGVPVSRTTFVGRERDCETALSALNETLLLSLLGPGGVGKTRLAAVVAGAAAPSFPSGGAFVDLVPAREATVVQTIAGTLGVTERPPESLERAIIERLRLGPSLLVLDNCEHLTDEVSGLVEEAWRDHLADVVATPAEDEAGPPAATRRWLGRFRESWQAIGT